MKTRWYRLVAGLCLFLICGAGPIPSSAQTPPQFTRALKLTNNEIALTFTTPSARAYRIETSSNILDWQPLITFPTNIGLSLSHTDTAAPFIEDRFYRAALLGGSNIFSGDHLDTANGELIIHPHQHAALILRWNGKVIHIQAQFRAYADYADAADDYGRLLSGNSRYQHAFAYKNAPSSSWRRSRGPAMPPIRIMRRI